MQRNTVDSLEQRVVVGMMIIRLRASAVSDMSIDAAGPRSISYGAEAGLFNVHQYVAVGRLGVRVSYPWIIIGPFSPSTCCAE